MIVLVVVAICFIASSTAAPADPVFELTDENFESSLRDKEVMLVDFYAPWCSDCERLKPIYNDAARELANQHKFVMAKMDCYGNGRYTCFNRLGIRRWPTLKVFKYGQYAGDYNGAEDKNQIEGFVNSFFANARNGNGKQLNDLAVWDQSNRVNHPCSNGCQNCGWTFEQMGPNNCG